MHLIVTASKDSLNAIEFAKRCKGIRFMEKDLRQSTTPMKRSVVAEQTITKSCREI